MAKTIEQLEREINELRAALRRGDFYVSCVQASTPPRFRNTMALTALPMATSPDVVVRVAKRACRLPHVLGSHAVAALVVDLWRDSFQMVRINAARVLAQVVNFPPRRYRASVVLMRHAMSIQSRLVRKSPVSIRRNEPRPFPALGRMGCAEVPQKLGKAGKWFRAFGAAWSNMIEHGSQNLLCRRAAATTARPLYFTTEDA